MLNQKYHPPVGDEDASLKSRFFHAASTRQSEPFCRLFTWRDYFYSATRPAQYISREQLQEPFQFVLIYVLKKAPQLCAGMFTIVFGGKKIDFTAAFGPALLTELHLS